MHLGRTIIDAERPHVSKDARHQRFPGHAGRFVEHSSGGQIEVFNPETQALVGAVPESTSDVVGAAVPESTSDVVGAAVSAARQAQRGWAKLPAV